ncbi:MAG: response regulator transcription factor [Bacteriovoracaceae bacterium]|nr:response regulator transcription factor [Bacteriovoracaceae bacterium]
MANKILCIEDDNTIFEVIKSTLSDYSVLQADTLQEASTLWEIHSFQLLVMDILLPDGDALEWYQDFRSRRDIKSVPLIVLSGQADISRKAHAFSLGAEDFIGKPFDPLEFKIRAQSKIKKFEKEQESLIMRKVGNVLIDGKKYVALWLHDSKEVDLGLTHTELKILNLLSTQMDTVYSREQILQHVWGSVSVADRTVDSHVAHLRNKLSKSNLLVDSVKSVGYKISIVTKDL